MAKTKKLKNSNNNEFRRLGVLLEHVDEKVGLIAEQHSDIKKTLDSHTKILEAHTEMIGNLAVDLEVVKSGLEIVKKDVKETKGDLNIVKGDVKTTRVDIEIIKADIEFIKNSIKKKVDVDEFAALERRVLILEKRR